MAAMNRDIELPPPEQQLQVSFDLAPLVEDGPIALLDDVLTALRVHNPDAECSVNQYLYPMEVASNVAITPPMQDWPNYSAAWDTVLSSASRYYLFTSDAIVYRELLDIASATNFVIDLCDPLSPPGNRDNCVLTLGYMSTPELIDVFSRHVAEMRQMRRDMDRQRNYIQRLNQRLTNLMIAVANHLPDLAPNLGLGDD